MDEKKVAKILERVLEAQKTREQLNTVTTLLFVIVAFNFFIWITLFALAK